MSLVGGEPLNESPNIAAFLTLLNKPEIILTIYFSFKSLELKIIDLFLFSLIEGERIYESFDRQGPATGPKKIYYTYHIYNCKH